MRTILQEATTRLKREHSLDVRKPIDYLRTLANPSAFKSYAKTLAEGLSESDRTNFLRIASNVRNVILESTASTSNQLTSYETLTIPILRNFYPKLIAKELVNVMPIDKPSVIKTFLKPKFSKYVADSTGGAYGDYTYSFPSNTDISRGPSHGIGTTADSTADGETDVLSLMGIASGDAHLERDFKIIGVLDSTGGVTTVSITPTVDGVFSVPVVLDSGSSDIVSGHVDYASGSFYWSCSASNVTGVRYTCHVSLEQNTINPKVRFETEKINFEVVDRRITADWTLNAEQDAKALFDVSVQAELVNIMGEQIAMDIDREIIADLISTNSTSNPASHSGTFYKIPVSGYALGYKEWAEQVVPTLNKLSAQIFTSTNMGAGNTIACNPLDAAIFESLNGFEYNGTASAGGELGYRSATVGSGKWKMLTSPNVTQGTVLVLYRSDDLAKASYVFAPYVPAMLSPYPLGNNPSLTIQSRYATQVIRPLGIATLTVSASQDPGTSSL